MAISQSEFPAVAGIDVGGQRKGFHLVVLKGKTVLHSVRHCNANGVVADCQNHGVMAVAIDAPCRWGNGEGARTAERELAQEGVFSYATPTRERAGAHAFYQWMLNGEALYAALSQSYPLLEHRNYRGGMVSFETFPHAITCAMRGTENTPAKKKRTQRGELLDTYGIDRALLRSIDAIDAALCALTAQHLLRHRISVYGEEATGFLFVPDIRQG